MYKKINYLSTYTKVVRVIHSCTTYAHYNTTVKYINLYLQSVPIDYKSIVRHMLIKHLNKQKFLIRYEYEFKSKKDN